MNIKKMRILSIDPGCNFTGVTIMELAVDGSIHVIFVETIKTNKLLTNMQDVIYRHGERFTKNLIVTARITKLLQLYTPSLVVSEAPYLGKFPQAFAALVEVINGIKLAVYTHDPSLEFFTIEPSVVKRNLKVSGTSKDKGLIKQALLLQPTTYESYLDVNTFDEHSCDSVAVGLAACTELNDIN